MMLSKNSFILPTIDMRQKQTNTFYRLAFCVSDFNFFVCSLS